jgi:hypothetical protein
MVHAAPDNNDNDDDDNDRLRHGRQRWGSVDDNNEMGKRMTMKVRGGGIRWQDNDSTIKLTD